MTALPSSSSSSGFTTSTSASMWTLLIVITITLTTFPLQSSAQCIQDLTALTTLVPINSLGGQDPTYTACESYCRANKFSLVGLQYVQRFRTTGMSGCSIYDGSLCYCTNSLSGGTTVDLGFGSNQPGYCGDCNTELSCGASNTPIPNLSQFAGKNCGLRYILDVEKGPGPASSNTTQKNAVFFYGVNSVPTTSDVIPTFSSSSSISSNGNGGNGGGNGGSSSNGNSISSNGGGVSTVISTSGGSTIILTVTGGGQSSGTNGGVKPTTSDASMSTSSAAASTTPIIAGATGGLAVVVIVVGIFVFYAYRRRKKDADNQDVKMKAMTNFLNQTKPDAPPGDFLQSKEAPPFTSPPLFPTGSNQPTLAPLPSMQPPYQQEPPIQAYPVQQLQAPPRVATAKASGLFSGSEFAHEATIGSGARFHDVRSSDEKIKLEKFALMTHKQGSVGSLLDFGKGLPDVARLDYGNVRGWSLEDVLVWVNGLGYVEQGFVERFRDNQATGAFLYRLSNNAVLANDILRSDFGIASADLRLRLIEDIRALCGTGDQVAVDSEVAMNAATGTLQPPPYRG
ncbi:hypothetical protein HDU76_011214 [Blyttiomyces sp. JEL0837]|nr:hypothetical protein HDU76_011214 [Blyttiomyces sp. JEL0837]